MTDRIIALIDMDCFYVQVEQRFNPSLKGKPCAVVQYNAWKGGGIIAVGYEARAFGVTRPMRGDDAKAKCPDIQLIKVPEARGKADLTRYREAGAEVISVFSKYCSSVERASIDEAYLDVTSEVAQRINALKGSPINELQIPNTYVEGYNGPEGRKEWLQKIYKENECSECEVRLAVAASLVEEMRAAVFKETGFTCSAGISHNKMLSKLSCGRNKPNKQTVLPHSAVPTLFSVLPLQKIRHLGGKLGASLLEMGLKTMSDLLPFTEDELHKKFGAKTGTWLYNACRGFNFEPVSIRELPKSIGCSKQFGGQQALDTPDKIKFWLSELAQEVCERLIRDKENNKRVAKCLTVIVGFNSSHNSSSRACALVKYEAEKIASDAFAMAKQFRTSPAHTQQWSPPFTYLGLSASRFSAVAGDHQNIASLFAASESTTQHKPVPSATFSDEDYDPTTSQVKDSSPGMSGVKINKTDKTKQSSNSSSKSTKNIQSFFSQKSKQFQEPTETEGHSSSTKAQTNQENTAVSSVKFSQAHSSVTSVKSVDEKSDVTSLKNVPSHSTPPSKENAKDPPVQSSQSPKGFFARKLRAIKNGKGSVPQTLPGSVPETLPGSVPQILPERNKESSTESDKELTASEVMMEQATDRVSAHSTSDISNGHSEQGSSAHKPTSTTNADNSEDYMTCDKCGQVVSMWDMPEHTDYHFALDLQKESRQQASTKTVSHGSTTKRKFKSPSKKAKGGKKKKEVVDKSIQPLTMFFSQIIN
uniref:DNA polymerase eta n=1 Tax=Biomphalaria glabrata TaxID=6526 RepID=A0A2C9JKM7_BIOGL